MKTRHILLTAHPLGSWSAEQLSALPNGVAEPGSDRATVGRPRRPIAIVHNIGAVNALEAAKRAYLVLCPAGDQKLLLRVRVKDPSSGDPEPFEYFECGAVLRAFALPLSIWKTSNVQLKKPAAGRRKVSMC